MKPTALLVHAPDVEAGLDWYQKAFPMAEPVYLPDYDFTLLRLGDFVIELVQADAKVSNGKSGTVLYWLTDNLQTRIEELCALGAKLYRGPLDIEDDMIMLQLEDPFGNLIGLRGRKN